MGPENSSKQDQLINAIREAKKNGTALLRVIYPEVKAALDDGVSYKVMAATLEEQGVKLTYRSLQTIMGRIAMEREQAGLIGQNPQPRKDTDEKTSSIEPANAPTESNRGLKEKGEKKADQYLGSGPLGQFDINRLINNKE